MKATGSYTIIDIADGLTQFYQYAISISSITIPTSGWAASMPASQAGKFIWRREGYGYTYADVTAWGNPMCLTGATGGKGDPGNPGSPGTPGTPGTDARSFQIVASPPTFAFSSRGVVVEAQTIALYCIKANIPDTTTVAWAASNLTLSNATGNGISISVPVGFEATEISISCTVSGFPVQTLKIMGVKAGDPLPVYLGVLTDPAPTIASHFALAGGKFIRGDFYLYQSDQGNFPKWFDGVSWSTVSKSTPNYSQICSTVLGDSLKQPSTIPVTSAIHGFFENLATTNGFIDQLSSNSGFIANLITNMVTIAYVLKSGNFDTGIGFKLDAEDGSFQIISGATTIRLDPQNGILVQVGGSTAFQVKLDGNFIFQNNIMAISQGSGDLYKNISFGMQGSALYQNLKSQHRSGLLSSSYARTFSATYAKEILVAEYANQYYKLDGSGLPGLSIAGVFRNGNTIRVIFKRGITVDHEWWNGSSMTSERISPSFSLLSTNNGSSWAISTVGSPGSISYVTRKYGLGLGQSGTAALICSYGTALNSVVGMTHSHYYKALDGWTYDSAVRFMILMMKTPNVEGIGVLVLVKKPSDSTATAQEEVSLNGLVGKQTSHYKILDIDGSNAVIFGENGYVIVSNNLATCSVLKTDLIGNIDGFMYVNNNLFVKSSIDKGTYSVSSSGITAVNIAFIDRAIEIDEMIVRGADFASSLNTSIQTKCTLPRTGSNNPFEMSNFYGFPIYDYSTGQFSNYLSAYVGTGEYFTARIISYIKQSVVTTPSNIASSSLGQNEMLTIDNYKVIISDDGLGVGFSLDAEISETFEFKSPVKVTTLESSGKIIGYVNGDASGAVNSYKVWGAVAN